MLYPKYDPDTYITRDLYRKVAETNDLRYVWAHKNSQKWKVDYDEFLKLCHETCDCCGSKLKYGIGKNNVNKTDEDTPSTDHIIPKRWGGKDEISNFWIICSRCNRLKNDAIGENDLRRFENISKVLREGLEASKKLKE